MSTGVLSNSPGMENLGKKEPYFWAGSFLDFQHEIAIKISSTICGFKNQYTEKMLSKPTSSNICGFPAFPVLQVVIFQLLGNQCERHLLHPGQTIITKTLQTKVYIIQYIYIIQIYVVYCGILCIYLHFCIVASGRFCPCSLARSLCLLISK